MKHVSLTFIVLCMLSGCSVVNVLRMKSANDDIQPVLPGAHSDHFQQSMQAFYIGEKPYIKVNVNGQEELLFLIDTGASFTMLFDTKQAANLRFEKGFSLEVKGWGDDDNSPAYQTQLNSLSFGNVSFNNVNVAYIPISTSQYYLTPDEAIFDGVLGHDLLRHFIWMYDKQANEIRVSNQAFDTSTSDVVLPMDTFFSKINIPVQVHIDGRDFAQDVIVDTGSRHYLKFNTAFIENNEITLPETVIQASDFGFSGEAKHTRIRLPELSLGKIKLPGIKANVIKADDEDDFWVIGSALMNQFVTIIDYPNQRMTFRPYDGVLFTTHYNLAGLDLRKLGNGLLIVRHVYPGLVADKKGFEMGAIVTSINQKEAQSITEEDWLEMSASPGTFEFCFKLRECSSITTQHIKGYSVESLIN